MRKSIDPVIADLAEQTARRRAPSSPRQKRRVRDLRHLAVALVLIGASSAICLWLLFV